MKLTKMESLKELKKELKKLKEKEREKKEIEHVKKEIEKLKPSKITKVKNVTEKVFKLFNNIAESQYKKLNKK